MLHGTSADGRIVVTKRAPFVALVLEEVRVDGANFDAVLACESGDRFRVLIRLEIPEYMDRDGRTATGQGVDVARVSEFVPKIDGGGILKKLSEASAGIGET